MILRALTAAALSTSPAFAAPSDLDKAAQTCTMHVVYSMDANREIVTGFSPGFEACPAIIAAVVKERDARRDASDGRDRAFVARVARQIDGGK